MNRECLIRIYVLDALFAKEMEVLEVPVVLEVPEVLEVLEVLEVPEALEVPPSYPGVIGLN